MHNARDFLFSLHQRGIRLWADNGLLRFHAARGRLLPSELTRLRALKIEILELLEPSSPFAEFPLEQRLADCQVPLTAVQRRWLSYVIKQHTGLMRTSTVAMHILGQLDVGLLRNSIEAVIERHESLRTRFVTVDGIPRQHIDAACQWNFDAIDRVGTIGEVERLAKSFVEQDMNVSEGPLFKARLFELSDREFVLVMALDHMITDGISKALLSKEIRTLYDKGAAGRGLWLPQLTLQFADYAVWQQRNYGAWLRKHEAYWRERMAAASNVQIPADGDSSEVRHPVGAMARILLGDALSAELRNLARRERTLLSLVVLTIYLTVMSRWCGRPDLLLTFAINGRDRPELRNILGFFASFLHLRIDISDADSLCDVLKQVNLEFHAACDHQDVAIDFIPEETTELSFNWLPIDSLQPSLQYGPEGRDRLHFRPFPLRAVSPCKFAPFFSDTEAGVTVTVLYRPDLISAGTIDRFGHDMRVFAEELVQRPLTRANSVLMTVNKS